MKNRIIAFLLASLMMLSCMVSVSGAAADVQSSDGSWEKYLPLFTALDIISQKDDYSSEEYITRAQFIKAAIGLYGENKDSYLNLDREISFEDVSSGSDCYPYVKAAVAAGLISEEGSFRPDDNIELAEAVKIMVSMLGYSSIAEVRGGYPTGYAAIATLVKLYKGIDKSSLYITPDTFSKLIRNTLTASVAIFNPFSGDSFTINVNNGKTLMEQNFNMFKDEGIVDADCCTTLLAGSSLKQGQLRINNEVYETADGNMEKLLGNCIEYYYIYNEESDKSKIVFYVISENKNRSVLIDADDIDAESCTTSSFVYYADNSKPKTAKLSLNASYIYNNVLKARSEVSLSPEVGNVELIDNNSDGVYEVVKIFSFETMVVNGLSGFSQTVMGKNGKTIDLGEAEDYNRIEKNGAEISFEEIQPNDVISYYESDLGDKYVRRLYVSSETVIGQIDKLSDDNAVINDIQYKYAKDIKNDLVTGVELKLYLDYLGRIVYVDSADTEYVYGYLRGIEKDGLNGVRVRLFTENGRWVTLNLKSRVKTNGGVKTDEELFDDITSLTSGYQQLVRYKVNSGAEVIEMNTAIDTERWSEAEKNAIDGDVFRRSLVLTNKRYRGGTNSIEGDLYLGNGAKIFYVPENTNVEEDYEIITIGNVFDYDDTIKTIEAYDMDRLGSAKACVLRHPAINKSYSEMFVLEELCESVNSEGKDNYILNGMFRKYNIDLKTSSTDVVKFPLNKGDILTLNFNSLGEVTEITRQYNIEDGAVQKFLINNQYDKKGYVAGKVLEVDFKQKRVVVDYGSSICIYDLSGLSNVYLYDSAREKIHIGSISDIAQEKYIFARVNYLRLLEIMIIE